MKSSLKNTLLKSNRMNIVIYGKTKKESKLSEKETASFRLYYMDLDRDLRGNGDDHLCSLDEAVQKQVDAFVIMRQMISCRHIFMQILEYSRKYNAGVYDENGRNIGNICEIALQKKYATKEVLLHEIMQHDYISFDIFDTLLTRKVLFPEDVFELTARRLEEEGIKIRKFKERRIEAQSLLGLTNPDIYEIYKKYQKRFKMTDSIMETCCRIEMEIEKEVLIPREEMVELYKQCIMLGKKAYIVSDMYLPKEFLKTVLEKCGITGYEKLYVSCDKKQLKLQGLLETYRGENPAGSYLHIGDHLIHDGICAGLAEMDYCLVANSYKMAEQYYFKDVIAHATTIEERVLLGMSIAKVLNSPFRGLDGKKLEVMSDYEYSYSFFAPIVSKFVLWLYEEIKRGGYTDVLFASRDGYLVQKMYEFLVKHWNDKTMPNGKYFYTSRKASVMTGINNEAFINMIIDISPGMPPKKMMRERFGLQAAKILEYDEKKYGDSIHKYVWDHADAIFKRAEEAKQNYYKYMGNIDLQIGKKYAFMDFVSSGTSQKSLKRMAPFEIKGLYAGWNGTDDKQELGVKALFEGENSYFMRHFKMMETFMTSEEPSLSHFDNNGNPVFSYQDRTEKELQYVKEMQQACIDFLDELLETMEVRQEEIHTDFSESVFAANENVWVVDQDSVLNHLRLMDDWRKKSNKIKDLIQ